MVLSLSTEYLLGVTWLIATPINGGNGTSETLPEWIAFDAADPHWMVLSEDEIGSEPVPEEKVVVYDAINTALEPNVLRGLNGGEDMFSE